MSKRVKTDVSYRVLLPDIPKMIIEKLKDTLPEGDVLPTLSNQKMNAYLKEIANLCGIDKMLNEILDSLRIKVLISSYY